MILPPMNNHFLIKLPEHLATELKSDLASDNYSNVEIVTKDDTTTFRFKGVEYSTIFYGLPTIIEIQKTMDKKQFFKVADVSNCLYVIDSNSHKGELTTQRDAIRREMANIESHTIDDAKLARGILELSGISPCLNLAKARRFRKKSRKTNEAEIKEFKVRELLERERRASSIQIIFGKDDDEDISSFAAEIEHSLIQEDKSEMNQDMLAKMGVLRDLEEKINARKELIQATSNIIVKKRFTEMLDKLTEEYGKVKKEIEDLENMKKNM